MFLDTFAWLSYFMGDQRGAAVRERLETTDVVYSCPMVIAELTSKLTRIYDAERAALCVAFVLEHAVLIPHDADIGQQAGLIHHEMKARVPDFGMADAFILAAARSRNTRVLTGDPHFKGVPEAELL